MNITKQLVLSSHHYYENKNDVQKLQEDKRTVRKVEGKGWTINDLFKEYYVIDEIKHPVSPLYFPYTATQMTLEQVVSNATCFAFNGSVRESNL
jgi:hypothetical protein